MFRGAPTWRPTARVSLWMILWMRMKISPSPAATTPMPSPAVGSQYVSVRRCATRREA